MHGPLLLQLYIHFCYFCLPQLPLIGVHTGVFSGLTMVGGGFFVMGYATSYLAADLSAISEGTYTFNYPPKHPQYLNFPKPQLSPYPSPCTKLRVSKKIFRCCAKSTMTDELLTMPLCDCFLLQIYQADSLHLGVHLSVPDVTGS